MSLDLVLIKVFQLMLKTGNVIIKGLAASVNPFIIFYLVSFLIFIISAFNYDW